ncbi:MAG: hypothetical protein IPF53_16385 [Blastocatellia bacterium]|nr:hypothetical protein [Blastocatellia bacterium]
MLTTRASIGVETTPSTSGTTVPDALVTASIGPVSTIAVRIRVRLREGAISDGPTRNAAKSSPAVTTPMTTRFAIRFCFTLTSTGRSIAILQRWRMAIGVPP